MNNSLTRISLALNAVLVLAVAALYYIVFSDPATSSKKPETEAAKPKPRIVAEDSVGPEAVTGPPAYDPSEDEGALAAAAASGRMGGIFFVNTDTLLEQYTVFKKAKAQLEGKSARFEAEMQNRTSKLQNELQQAQQKVQSGGVTQEQAQQMEQQFMEKQQNLAQYRDMEGQKLVDEEHKLTTRLNNDIQKFMKGFGKSRGYKYVLGYTSGGGILFANDSLDITKDVVKGINKK